MVGYYSKISLSASKYRFLKNPFLFSFLWLWLSVLWQFRGKTLKVKYIAGTIPFCCLSLRVDLNTMKNVFSAVEFLFVLPEMVQQRYKFKFYQVKRVFVRLRANTPTILSARLFLTLYVPWWLTEAYGLYWNSVLFFSSHYVLCWFLSAKIIASNTMKALRLLSASSSEF